MDNTIINSCKSKKLKTENEYRKIVGRFKNTLKIGKVREEYELDNGEKILILNKNPNFKTGEGYIKINIENEENKAEFILRKYELTGHMIQEQPMITKGSGKVELNNNDDTIKIILYEGFDTDIVIEDLLNHKIIFETR